jgi:hypothetical protein
MEYLEDKINESVTKKNKKFNNTIHNSKTFLLNILQALAETNKIYIILKKMLRNVLTGNTPALISYNF